ncbi:MAG: PRC-barrel domain-containing protein [Nitratireductor sp.]|jgi:sporulation protein YlmC with PRC-barrel domain|nr:PRC-barrel domain-containing protein [Nitratireductor sp.]
MIRTLLTTTALVALLHTGAMAQETQQQTEQPQVQQNQATQPGRLINRDTQYQRNVNEQGYFTAGQGEILASTLIGKAVYGSANEDAERIGDVNDIVISPNGTAEAVIIGVGGFLGLGEKDVAVDFSRVSWVDRDGDRWFVVEANKEELEGAPAFDRSPTEPEPATVQDNTGVTVQQQTAADQGGGQVVQDQNQQTAANQNAEQQQVQTNQQQAGNMPDRNAMQPMDMATMRAEDLQGKRVYGANNEDIGEISDVLLTQDGKIDAFVVDVGGFLGMGEKEVAIGMQNIDFMQDNDGNIVVFTPFTQAQLEQSPQYSQEAYQNDRNNTILMAP